MLSLPPEEAGWELMGGRPWPPQESRGWSLLGVIASRGGGAIMPNANDKGSQGGRGLCSPNSPLLWKGGRIKQQQKHHPLGERGLHSLPSLRSGFFPPSCTHPLQPPMASAVPPTLWEHVMACKGQHCAQSIHSQLLTPPRKGGGEGIGPAPRG